jgi:hypothetical protein
LDDEVNAPMVRISFSEETLAFLGNDKLLVVRAMIEAGMDAAGDLAEQQIVKNNLLLQESDERLLH